jgi:phospholipid transport system substrate-binding protein
LKEKFVVTTRSVTRANFLSGLIGLGAFVVAPNAHAARNSDAERYVETNATNALRALANSNAAQRRQQFQTLMTQFADMDRISTYMVGRYSPALRADPDLRRDWRVAFQDFAIATYEDQFQNLSGGTVSATDSEERVAGRDVIVTSNVRPTRGATMQVQWRVLRSGAGWKVMDVAVGRDAVWLGQIQQRQFLAQLDDNNGNVRALINDLRGRTTAMRGAPARS